MKGNNNLIEYLRSIKNYDDDIWFLTKQNLSNMELVLRDAKVVLKFNKIEYTKGMQKFYQTEVSGSSQEQYRNLITCKYFGLVKETKKTKFSPTIALKIIEKYGFNESIIQSQLLKFSVNINPSINSKNFNFKKSVTLFVYPTLFKVLEIIDDNKISFEEFVVFIVRIKKYSDIKTTIELIHSYRKIKDEDIKEMFDKVFKATKKNLRIWNILSFIDLLDFNKKQVTLKNKYKKYIKDFIKNFENGSWALEDDKNKIHEFLCSEYFFENSTIFENSLIKMYNSDNVGTNNILIFQDEEMFEELKIQNSFKNLTVMNQEEIIKYENSKPLNVKKSELITWKRNLRLSKTVLFNSLKKCQIDDSHWLFQNPNNEVYLEVHHLIPMHKQNNFKNNLDSMDNLFVLCPSCHRAFHYGNTEIKLKIIKILFYKNSKRLIKRYNINFENLLEIYDIIPDFS